MRKTAISGYNCGDSLMNKTIQELRITGLDSCTSIGMAMYINKTWSCKGSISMDNPFCAAANSFGFCYYAIFNTYICTKPRISRAVNNFSILNCRLKARNEPALVFYQIISLPGNDKFFINFCHTNMNFGAPRRY
jgi:hypothetical protein